ncbi:10743_t:CDS:10 [Entrophospora sp. SA101]|nr:10743_t:CDS:10 [Entrophospora sp. SA101]
MESKKIKDTLLLPQTSFPLKNTNHCETEKKIRELWEEKQIYQQVLEKNKNNSAFILHSGPPYANGWDTHGLPIEHKVIQTYQSKKINLHQVCHDFALTQVQIQKEQLKKLGLFTEYNHYYITLNKEYEAEQIRVFGEMVKKGLIYQGFRPIYWSCGHETALAEAEIEYYEKKDTSLYFKINGRQKIGFLCFVEKVFSGEKLLGLTYFHPYQKDRKGYIVDGSDFIEEGEGTGIVHLAPAFGAEDFAVAKKEKLTIECPLEPNGIFNEKIAVSELIGKHYSEVNNYVITDLETRNLTIEKEVIIEVIKKELIENIAKNNEPILNPKIIDYVAEIVASREETILGEDIMDVWLDSGDTPYGLSIFKPEKVKELENRIEIVRQLYIVTLLEDYNYPKSRIKLEHSIHFGREKKSADIVIFDKDRPNVEYIIVEVKKPNEKLGKEQLKSYCNATEITALPNSEQSLADILKERYTLKDLIIKDKIPNEGRSLKQIILSLEDEVLANAGVDVFEEVFKLIFTKLYDEHQSKRDKEVLYRALRKNLGSGWYSDFNKVKNFLLNFDDDKESNIELAPSHLAICISGLQDVKLFNTNLQVIDEAFECLVSKSSKGEKGQYFTPRHVIDMCVKMLNPKKGEFMIDTAAGSCGFPVHVIFYIFNSLLYGVADEEKENIEKIFGIDFDEKVVRVARTLNLIAGDGNTNVLHLNTLDYDRWNENSESIKWWDIYGEGFKRLKKLRKNSSNKEFLFDILMANPPFAGDIKESRIIHKYELGYKQKDQKRSPKNQIGRDILFIERNLDFLKPGGRMAIVLPQGRFNNTLDKELREYIANRARIIAVIGLHVNTFKPHTGTKTSVLFLQKWNDNPKFGALCPKLEDYPIFFAVSEKGGKDNSGEYIYVKDELGKPKIDGNGHLIIDNDLYNHALNDSNDSKELPDGVAEDNLERTFRIDAEFYKPEILNSLNLLSKKQPLTNYVKVSDGNHSKITEYFQDYPGIPYYGGKDVSANFFIENAKPVYIPEKKYNKKEMRRSHFLPGDILLTTVGIIGNLSLITDTIKESTGARSVGFLRPTSELSSEYIASFLMSKYGLIQLKRIARGSVQVRMILEDFDQIQLYPCSNKFDQTIKQVIQLSIKLNATRKQQYHKAEKILATALDLEEFQLQHKLTFAKNFSDIKQVERYDAEYFQPKFDEIIKRINKYKKGCKNLEDLISVIGHPANPPYGTKSLYTTDEFITRNKNYILSKNDIILYSAGAAYVGKANLYNSSVRATFGSFLTLIRQDQFRGWFNSSLITAVILANQAPYQQVLSHGFVVDEKGHKMSKSLEVKVSIPILEKVQESYQKIRNTLRFLLGNLANLPPEIKSEKDLETNLNSVDYHILHKLERLVAESQKNYNEYNFNPGLLKIIVPILPYLAEEIYQNTPFQFGFAGQESIQLVNYHWNLPLSLASKKKSELINVFFLPLRQEIYQSLEQARQEKIIATNSQAHLIIYLKEEKISEKESKLLSEKEGDESETIEKKSGEAEITNLSNYKEEIDRIEIRFTYNIIGKLGGKIGSLNRDLKSANKIITEYEKYRGYLEKVKDAFGEYSIFSDEKGKEYEINTARVDRTYDIFQTEENNKQVNQNAIKKIRENFQEAGKVKGLEEENKKLAKELEEKQSLITEIDKQLDIFPSDPTGDGKADYSKNFDRDKVNNIKKIRHEAKELDILKGGEGKDKENIDNGKLTILKTKITSLGTINNQLNILNENGSLNEKESEREQITTEKKDIKEIDNSLQTVAANLAKLVRKQEEVKEKKDGYEAELKKLLFEKNEAEDNEVEDEALRKLKEGLHPESSEETPTKKSGVAITNENFQTFIGINDNFLAKMQATGQNFGLSAEELADINSLREELGEYPLFLYQEFKTEAKLRLDEFYAAYPTDSNISSNYQEELAKVKDFDFNTVAKISRKTLNEEVKKDYENLSTDEFIGDANRIRAKVIAEIQTKSQPNLDEAKTAAKERLIGLIRKSVLAGNGAVNADQLSQRSEKIVEAAKSIEGEVISKAGITKDNAETYKAVMDEFNRQTEDQINPLKDPGVFIKLSELVDSNKRKHQRQERITAVLGNVFTSDDLNKEPYFKDFEKDKMEISSATITKINDLLARLGYRETDNDKKNGANGRYYGRNGQPIMGRRPIRTYTQLVNNSIELTKIIEEKDTNITATNDNPNQLVFKKILQDNDETKIDIDKLKKIIELSDKVSEEKLTKYEEIVSLLNINLDTNNRYNFDSDGSQLKQFLTNTLELDERKIFDLIKDSDDLKVKNETIARVENNLGGDDGKISLEDLVTIGMPEYETYAYGNPKKKAGLNRLIKVFAEYKKILGNDTTSESLDIFDQTNKSIDSVVDKKKMADQLHAQRVYQKIEVLNHIPKDNNGKVSLTELEKIVKFYLEIVNDKDNNQNKTYDAILTTEKKNIDKNKLTELVKDKPKLDEFRKFWWEKFNNEAKRLGRKNNMVYYLGIGVNENEEQEYFAKLTDLNDCRAESQRLLKELYQLANEPVPADLLITESNAETYQGVMDAFETMTDAKLAADDKSENLATLISVLKISGETIKKEQQLLQIIGYSATDNDKQLKPDPHSTETDPTRVLKIYYSDFKKNRVGEKNLAHTNQTIEGLIDIENGTDKTNNKYLAIEEDFEKYNLTEIRDEFLKKTLLLYKLTEKLNYTPTDNDKIPIEKGTNNFE